MQKFQCVEAIIYLFLYNLHDCTCTPFEMTLNSKHRTEKLKTKTQRYRNMKNQIKIGRPKSSLTIEEVESGDFYKPALGIIRNTRK